jgi:hypothetical protein
MHQHTKIYLSLAIVFYTFGCSRDPSIQTVAPAMPKSASADDRKSLLVSRESAIQTATPALPKFGFGDDRKSHLITPFELSKFEKKRFIDKLKTLKRGDKLTDVVELLGPPFYVSKIQPKRLQSEAEQRLNETLVTYLLKKSDVVTNTNDPAVNLLFEPDGKLEGIATNIANLDVGDLILSNTKRIRVDEADGLR